MSSNSFSSWSIQQSIYCHFSVCGVLLRQQVKSCCNWKDNRSSAITTDETKSQVLSKLKRQQTECCQNEASLFVTTFFGVFWSQCCTISVWLLFNLLSAHIMFVSGSIGIKITIRDTINDNTGSWQEVWRTVTEERSVYQGAGDYPWCPQCLQVTDCHGPGEKGETWTSTSCC